MSHIKRAAADAALWLLTWLVMPLGATILYGAYVLTGCRAGRILKAANALADTFLMLMVVYVFKEFYSETKGDHG